MSVLIKGMEMPTRCEDCFCYRHNAEYDYAYCNISSTNVLGHGNARLNSCPLVLVPEHGDLIDRDALMKILSKVIDINASIEQRNEATDQERRCLWWFEQQIGIAPTIIPADPTDKEAE